MSYLQSIYYTIYIHTPLILIYLSSVELNKYFKIVKRDSIFESYDIKLKIRKIYKNVL